MRFDSDHPFKNTNSGPAPLRISLERKIRFGECDPMGVVWHGHYAIYAEEAREALYEACGFPYSALKGHGVMLPVKALFFDYLRPLFYERVYSLSASLRWTEAARINIEYLISEKGEETPRTRGFSVQLMTDLSARLLLDWPPFFQDFARRWQLGELACLQDPCT